MKNFYWASIILAGNLIANVGAFAKPGPVSGAYTCKLVKYVKEGDASYENLASLKVFADSKDDKATKWTSDEGKTSELHWRMFRKDGLMTVEVANAEGKVFTLSSTNEGNALLVKVPSTKNILNCNPPSERKIGVNPANASGEYEEMILINPANESGMYETISVLRLSDDKIKAQIKALNAQNDSQLIDDFKNFLRKYLGSEDEDLE